MQPQRQPELNITEYTTSFAISIATEVLQMCISRNIVVLSYHDSFRVKREDKEILKGIMFEGWKRVMKTTNNCVVEEK